MELNAIRAARKRNRRKFSCTNCRQKKRKCDRKLPCSTCVKYKFQDTCSYDEGHGKEQEEIDETTVFQPLKEYNEDKEDINTELRKRLHMLESAILLMNQSRLEPEYISSSIYPLDDLSWENIEYCIKNRFPSKSEETLSFSSACGNLAMSSRYTCKYFSVLKHDPGAQLCWKYRSSRTQDSLVVEQTVSDVSLLAKKRGLLDSAFLRYGNAYIPPVDSNADIYSIKRAISVYGSGLGFSFDLSAEELSLLEKIKTLLPCKSDIMKLSAIFFSELYPYFPILDESMYYDSLNRLLIFEGDMLLEIKLKKCSDLSIIAQILILCRFVYCFHLKGLDKGSLSENPVCLDSIDLAETCIEYNHPLKKTNFESLQAMLMLYIYRIYSPGDPATSAYDDMRILYANVLQLSEAFRLNVDTSFFYDISSLKIKNLRSKIWSVIVCEGLYLTSLFGWIPDPRIIYSDIRIPEFCMDACNVSSIETEKKTIEIWQANIKLWHLKSAALDAIAGSPTVSVLKFLEVSGKLEISCDEIMQIFTEKEINIDSFDKAFKMKLWFESKIITFYGYHVLYLLYDQKKNHSIAFFYLMKVVHTIFHEIFNACISVGSSFKDNLYYMIVAPYLSAASMLTSLVLLIFSIRLECTHIMGEYLEDTITYDQPEAEDPKKHLVEMVSLIKDFLKFKEKALQNMRKGSFNGWKCVKLDAFFLELLSKEGRFTHYKSFGKLPAFNFSRSHVIALKQFIGSSFLLEEKETVSQNQMKEYMLESFQNDNMWLQLNALRKGREKLPFELQDEGSSNGGSCRMPFDLDSFPEAWYLDDVLPTDNLNYFY